MAHHTPKSKDLQETLDIAKAELDQVRNKMSKINGMSHDMEAAMHTKMSVKFNAIYQDIEAAIQQVDKESTPENIEANLRIKEFHQWHDRITNSTCQTHAHRSELGLGLVDSLANIFQFVSSAFAVRSLWIKQGAIDYVLEVEKRRKKDLPAETFKEHRERTRSGIMKFPLFMYTIILITVAVFVLDMGIETTFRSQPLQLVKKHPNCAHLLVSMIALIVTGLFLEGRHGSSKVARVSCAATCAAVVLGFSYDPTNSVYVSITLAHVLLGMNWADMWINWGMFIELPALSLSKIYGKGLEEEHPPLFRLQQLHMVGVGVVEILPLGYEMTTQPEWLGNAFCNIFGFLFGFFFMLPFLSNMANSRVFGDKPEWRGHFKERCSHMWGDLFFCCFLYFYISFGTRFFLMLTLLNGY